MVGRLPIQEPHQVLLGRPAKTPGVPGWGEEGSPGDTPAKPSPSLVRTRPSTCQAALGLGATGCLPCMRLNTACQPVGTPQVAAGPGAPPHADPVPRPVLGAAVSSAGCRVARWPSAGASSHRPTAGNPGRCGLVGFSCLLPFTCVSRNRLIQGLLAAQSPQKRQGRQQPLLHLPAFRMRNVPPKGTLKAGVLSVIVNHGFKLCVSREPLQLSLLLLKPSYLMRVASSPHFFFLFSIFVSGQLEGTCSLSLP